jgi:2-polyprenyl-6-methoxyphenol hydroxylase-like FAD-dependent oxidoreductase
MESAAALADELSRTDARFVPHALELYVKRHARRVFAAQENSRRLGKLMTVNTLPLAWGRDQLMKLMTLDSLIRDIQKELDEPI